DTVGIDLVAMNVNDLICTGARPLFFLDYFACGKLDVRKAEEVIRGIQRGCEESECVLLGGETAEMPGFYAAGEYDLAGFAVGLAQKKTILPKKNIREGDMVIGLPSSGPHSNGYSLIRKVFSERELRAYGKELLAPTHLYVKKILSLLDSPLGRGVKGIAHVTGGGWYENIPRMFSKGVGVEIKFGNWPKLPIFNKIQVKGRVPEEEMFRTFNMGIGLVLTVEKSFVFKIIKFLKEAYLLGTVKNNISGVVFK
ncbi:MAG: phosphoribosylformylglycinamidine cyclo-ligase, partial [Elusimicrobia bacterium]|nr:phosphoribosylformylglycinamidine cyclo-ligase [Elusimicrobiota bacterium]